MIKIGDFARIGGVSVATLRYYDEEGLLRPSYVHPDSGYRYFESVQIRTLRRILLLKRLGFSLPEIRMLLEGEVDQLDLQRLLLSKREEAERRIEEAEAQIRKIDHHIATIEKEKTVPQLEVVRKLVPALPVLAIHLEIASNEQVGDLLGKAYCDLSAQLGERRISAIGPCMAVWYSSPQDLMDETVDAAIPLQELVEGGQVLPEVEVAAVVHRGPFSEFQECHVALSEWLAANRCRLDGPYREIYHEHSEETSTTEVQYPITPE